MPDATSLGERLRRAGERAFLAGDDAAPSLLYVHGPGGVGKSTPLRPFAAEAAGTGRTVVEVEGRSIDPSPGAFGIAATSSG
jgi:predicted AAA+ superfamily ATPase